MSGQQAAQKRANGCVVTGGRVVGPAFCGGDGGLQLAEHIVVLQVAANVDGGALVQLILGGFDGLFEGAALGQFGGGDGACQTRVYGAIFAGCQQRRQGPFQLVVGLLRDGFH